ncbi:MAG: hypothetical protein AB7P02_30425, partial [Alphaproteobacteria bacterium]
MARLQPVAQSFQLAIETTMAALQKSIVDTAQREHARVMATEPRPHQFTRRVDGVLDAPEEAVRPAGVIVYEYDRFPLVAAGALDILREESPVKDGDYRDGHVFFLNGTQVADLAGYRAGDEISISNLVPYARKIEVGRIRFRAPGGEVYRRALPRVRRAFGALADFRFEYRSVALPYIALGGRRGGRTAGAAKRSA